MNDKKIKPNERVFYTSRNAMYIDTARQIIENVPQKDQKYFLAPLLSEASIHANTSGVFKGFYKNKETGIGQFGGLNKDALFRITGNIKLPFKALVNGGKFSTGRTKSDVNSENIVPTCETPHVTHLDASHILHDTTLVLTNYTGWETHDLTLGFRSWTLLRRSPQPRA
jgi:hypothetical protein